MQGYDADDLASLLRGEGFPEEPSSASTGWPQSITPPLTANTLFAHGNPYAQAFADGPPPGRRIVRPRPGVEQPQMQKASVPPLPVSSKHLMETLSEPLGRQLALKTYNRSAFIGDFLKFYQDLLEADDVLGQRPTTPVEALKQFGIDSHKAMGRSGGGHCLALSKDLIKETGEGYLCPSILPTAFQQKGAPEFCHVATLVPFENPEDSDDRGVMLMEPGFNFPNPIIIRDDGKPFTSKSGKDEWKFWWDEDSQMICGEPQGVKFKNDKDRREKCVWFQREQFVNPDNAVTLPLLCVDRRPSILARDETGEVFAVLAINMQPKKDQVEIRIGELRQKPVPFQTAVTTDDWLSEEAAVLLGFTKEKLLEHIRMIIVNKPVLDELLRARLNGEL
jgi:hypothetical protein